MGSPLSRRRRVRYSLLFVAVLIAVIGLAPTVLPVFAERQLADAVETFASAQDILKMDDRSIRSRVQQLARASGFRLEFEDIYLEYLSSPQNGNRTEELPPPVKLGYTLSMQLPLFGLVPRSVVSVRLFPVLGDRNE